VGFENDEGGNLHQYLKPVISYFSRQQPETSV
jgi:hypothetical protein